MACLSTLINRNFLRVFISLIGLALLSTNFGTVKASPCVIFDAEFNLYAFGFGGKDLKLGLQEQWNSAVNPTDVTSTGRPNFDGPQTTCYLAQFLDAIYVLDGDKSNPTDVYIYDVSDGSWTTQKVSSGGPDPSSLVAILDHDTNVAYAMADGTMSFLDLGQLKKANSTSLTWSGVGKPPFGTTGYNPVMALAQNHIHFIGVPGSRTGTANIFVIHFSYFQPDAQSYPAPGGDSSFPSAHGQTASFFRSDGVQQEFAFIPDDASATYVVNVESNTTLPLPGPSDKSPSRYAASINALVQLTASGSIYFLPYAPGDASQSQNAIWHRLNVQGLPATLPGTTSSNGSTGNGARNGTTTGGSGNGTTTNGSGGSQGEKNSGALPAATRTGMAMLVCMLGGIAFDFVL